MMGRYSIRIMSSMSTTLLGDNTNREFSFTMNLLSKTNAQAESNLHSKLGGVGVGGGGRFNVFQQD